MGGSTAKPAWMNIRNAPALAQTAGRWDKASLTSEVSEFQTSVTWGVYPAMSLPPYSIVVLHTSFARIPISDPLCKGSSALVLP